MASSSTSPDINVTVYQQIVASATGALLVSVSMTPIDVVKVRLQSQGQPLAKGECFLFSNGLMDHLCMSCSEPAPSSTKCEWYNRPGHFNGTIDAFIKITRNEGVRSLWSGLWPTIISAIPATVLYFTAYDNFLREFRKKTNNQWLPPLLAGSIARGSVVFLVSPLELLRTKMQSEILTFKDLKKSVKLSVKQDGILSLWRGLNATLLRDIPFSAIYWTSYEYLKARSLTSMDRNTVNFPISFGCGAISGTIASIVSHPFDVVKTHKQITLGQVRRLPSGKQCQIGSMAINKSMAVVMKEIVSKEGVRGLFTGLTPRLVKVPPACAIMIGTYEYLKLWFSRQNHKLEN